MRRGVGGRRGGEEVAPAEWRGGRGEGRGQGELNRSESCQIL